jgi:very-short-patch-repair endonuclease
MPHNARIRPSTNRNARELRRNPTDAERALWQRLRQRQVAGLKFRRQHTIGRYILDFVCLEAKLVVELDGGHHAQRRQQDQERTAWLEARGYRVLRFWNTEVLQNPDGVLALILRSAAGLDVQPPS